jgi:hypothetical protein
VQATEEYQPRQDKEEEQPIYQGEELPPNVAVALKLVSISLDYLEPRQFTNDFGMAGEVTYPKLTETHEHAYNRGLLLLARYFDKPGYKQDIG